MAKGTDRFPLRIWSEMARFGTVAGFFRTAKPKSQFFTFFPAVFPSPAIVPF